MMAEQQQNFFRRVWTELPLLFPLVALFHFAILIITIAGFAQADALDATAPAGTCIELLLYTLLWLFVCLQHRWAAIGYILLTCVNLALQYLTAQGSIWRDIADAMAPAHLPIDALFCFFLLFYYKRFH
jgi:hypothetical protein